MITILAPAGLDGAPLADLKQWLAITTTQDDALLLDLLASAHTMCHRFTGLVPQTCEVTETVAVRERELSFGARPVVAFIEAVAIDHTLARRVLADAEARFELTGDGGAVLVLDRPLAEPQVELTYRAGRADSWNRIEDGLRHGIVRFAAHLYRLRDDAVSDRLPAAVAALWQPYRRMRL